MTAAEFAQLLVESHAHERVPLMSLHKDLSPIKIAEELQQRCYEVWTEDPQKVSLIADALHFLEGYANNAEVKGYALWVEGICQIVEGDLMSAIEYIDRSESVFSEIDKEHLAAKTQAAKIYSLAMLGRYDEAVRTGEKALKVFLEHKDLYSAGKIEHNIGNLYWRRDMYREAEPYLASARERFVEIDDQRQIAMVENCQAFVKTLQNQFREAEAIYKRALERTAANNLTVTEAEIETGLSNLYLFESRYDLALKFMERSHQKYERLGMPNQSAMCELEMADIYLELNLLPEAIEFYKKVAIRLSDLGLQAELARCSLSHARALIRTNKKNEASVLLGQAEDSYKLEGNAVGKASVQLVRAQLFFEERDLANAAEQIALAKPALKNAENLRLYLFAKWLRAEIMFASGNPREAITELEATLSMAHDLSREVSYLCLTSLGKMLTSEDYLRSAIDLVESSRSTLALDELRTSYFAEKIAPYNELIKIKLDKGQYEDAFYLHERSRARTLTEEIRQPRKDAVSDDRLVQMREELDWYYNRINKSSRSHQSATQTETLRELAHEREKEYTEMLRRLGIRDEQFVSGTSNFDLTEIRRLLDDTTFIEFALIDGRISAFVISKERFTALPNYAYEAEINNEIRRFLFQLKTGRTIDRLSKTSRSMSFERLRSHSIAIYDKLLKPFADLIQSGRLVFAPAGLMHYLPFHALHDGNEYLIERFEISYAPSISVLDHCLRKPEPKLQQALIVGNADLLTPMVESEVETIAAFFKTSSKLTGNRATINNIRENAVGSGVVHFACHGKFRPDNPGFSSLSLFEEELTMNEVRNLPFDDRIIILGACETGLNEVVRGEELIGLTRAFFAAGAASLVLSLWRVDDRVTLDLMKAFYKGLFDGKGIAGSLRSAQVGLIKTGLHPYFWSPFVVSGRW